MCTFCGCAKCFLSAVILYGDNEFFCLYSYTLVQGPLLYENKRTSSFPCCCVARDFLHEWNLTEMISKLLPVLFGVETFVFEGATAMFQC